MVQIPSRAGVFVPGRADGRMGQGMIHCAHDRYTSRLVSMREPEKVGQDWRAILVTVLVALAIAFGVRSFVVESFSVEGYSMLPTLATGDRVLVNKLAFVWGKPRTGEIIVFHSPEIANQDWIKRVIGVPGDTVSIQHNVVYINGRRYPEPFLAYRHSVNVPPTKIPAGYVFVLGDNRPDSNDSRYWGPLAESRIIGRAVLEWWPVTNMRGLP